MFNGQKQVSLIFSWKTRGKTCCRNLRQNLMSCDRDACTTTTGKKFTALRHGFQPQLPGGDRLEDGLADMRTGFRHPLPTSVPAEPNGHEEETQRRDKRRRTQTPPELHRRTQKSPHKPGPQ